MMTEFRKQNKIQTSARCTWIKYCVQHIAHDKMLLITKKCAYFFLFLHENKYCGYPLETPHRGASNEYLHEEIRFFYPSLSDAI